MRFSFTKLAAPLLLASAASAQVNPNAIGIWRSDNPMFAYYVIPGIPAGQTGNSVWACLPPDMITYFRPQAAGGLRELDFWGVELKVVTPPNTTASAKIHQIPGWEIRRAVQANSPNEGALIPFVDPQNPNNGLFAKLTSGGGISVAANTAAYNLYTVKNMLAASVPVPAGSAAGDGLAWMMVDYCKQYGSPATAQMTQTSLMMSCTQSETHGVNSPGYSGQTISGGMPTPGSNLIEFCVTFFFEQSMIAPTKNAKLLPPGGTLPASVTVPVAMDDGHGALTPSGGEWISYTANSNKSLKPGNSTNVWLVPFMLFEGDVTSGLDPAPENWVANGGAVQNSFIHPMPLQKWLDDTVTLFGIIPPPNFSQTLNPGNSTLGLWLGVDLPNFININVLLNGFTLADASAPAFAGPETKMYDKPTNPTGVMVRNFAAWNTTLQGEMRTLQTAQTGYTPILPLSAGGDLGIGQHPGLPQLAGLAFQMTCWVLDKQSPSSPIGYNIIDMTNVIRVTL
jgi:hypothetical protein